MNEIPVKSWALGLAVFSFGFLSVGSFLFGATATTSVLRGFGGAILFGALIWGVGTIVIREENIIKENMLEEEGDQNLQSSPEENELMEFQDK